MEVIFLKKKMLFKIKWWLCWLAVSLFPNGGTFIWLLPFGNSTRVENLTLMSGLVSGNAKQLCSWGKESPHKERWLPLPLAPLHFRPARWLQWCFYFFHSGPTPLPNLLPGTLPTANSHSSPSTPCGFSRSGCFLKDTEEKHPRKPNPCKRYK